jgi:dTDP-4-amino-4,6-dideoxy-D-glucose ammonia-lyase
MVGQHRFKLDSALLEKSRGASGLPQQVAVVGAGRWGRVICRVLAELSPRLSTIHVVAERNYPETCEWLEESSKDGLQHCDRIIVRRSLAEILELAEVEVAIVTRMASQHYTATRELLLANKHVLVEKPFVLRAEQARELVELARERNRVLAVGYEFMFARALHHYGDLIDRHLGNIHRIDFVWKDRPGVVKWGVRKQADLSANIVTDLYPHVLSQLHLLLGRRDMSLRELSSSDGCWQADIELEYGTVPVRIALDKRASETRRSISVTSSRGRTLALDYTNEPGEVTLDGQKLAPDQLDQSFPGSLTSQLAYFFARTRDADAELPNAASDTVDFVEATELANSRLVARQTEVLASALSKDLPGSLPTEVSNILRHQTLDPLMAHGILSNPKDTNKLDLLAARIFRIVHRFARDPWTTQESISSQEVLSRDELVRLNSAIRDSTFLQNLIVEEGIAKKYWETILPLIQSGSIQAASTNDYRFPLRVAVYAAVSCMFQCSFCGRSPDARYQNDDVEPGNDMFDRVFAEMPEAVSTLSLGGGLEPLTNPNIGNVIRTAKRNGHRVPLLTNGFMLTPRFVARHEGLWELDVLRISWYGVDEESYHEVTRRRGAFELVKENLIEFLKERNRRGSNVKVGINFIVLMNTTDRVLKLLDVINEINDAVGGPGLDFLSLREDFSVPEADGLAPEERRALIAIFDEFNGRRARECPDLKVDFGYALYPLNRGVVGEPLTMVTHEGMLPRAYPQVSVAIDILGDVYLYHEAGFLDRPGSERYIIGKVTKTRSLEQVLRDFLNSGREIPAMPGDPTLMDAFDHVVTRVISQSAADERVGIGFNDGPVCGRVYVGDDDSARSDPKVVNYWHSMFKM